MERKKSSKRSRPPKAGRPVTNQIEPIPASPEEVARALCRAADKKADKRLKEPAR